MHHEPFVRNELEPSETEARITLRSKTFEEIRHRIKYHQLSLGIEGARVINNSQYVEKHSVVRSLVELSLFSLVIIVENFIDLLKYFSHKLVFIELELANKHYDQLDKAINVSVIESIGRSRLA